MKALVFGGGAVGLGLASHLMQAGVEAHVVARAATAQRLRREGLRRSGLFGSFVAPPGSFGAYGALEQIPVEAPFDYVLVCVKSFDTAAAAEALARRPELLGGAGRIVLCQNGWGNREAFQSRFPWPLLYSARVITGFSRPRENEVEVTVHADAMHVGTLGGAPLEGVAPLCAAIAAGGFPCEATPHIERDLWAKMLYNCALNPLGAIFDVPYGALAESAHTRRLMNTIHQEVYAVMRADGRQTHWTDAKAYQKVFYERLVPATAAHCSSTLQDIRAGKRTEIDALSGAIVELGRRYGVEVPVNAAVYDMVKFQEARHMKAGAGE